MIPECGTSREIFEIRQKQSNLLFIVCDQNE